MKSKVFAFFMTLLCAPSAYAQLNNDANVFSLSVLGGYLEPNTDYFFNYAPKPSASYGISIGYMRVMGGHTGKGLYFGGEARFLMSRMKYDLISFDDATILAKRFQSEDEFRTYIDALVIEVLRMYDFGAHLNLGYRVGPIGVDVPVVLSQTLYGYKSRTDGFRNWLIQEITNQWPEDAGDVPFIQGDFDIESGFTTSYGLGVNFFVPSLPKNEYIILRGEYLRVVDWGSQREPLPPSGATPSNPVTSALTFSLVFGFEF
jgi:hypothetical protein